METELKELKCKKCGHSWNSRTNKPVSCPRCKSYDWNKTKEVRE